MNATEQQPPLFTDVCDKLRKIAENTLRFNRLLLRPAFLKTPFDEPPGLSQRFGRRG